MDVLVIGAGLQPGEQLEAALALRGHRLAGVEARGRGLELVRTRRVDAVVVPAASATPDALLEQVRELSPGLPVIVAGERDVTAAARAAAQGAFGYVPLDPGGELGPEACGSLADLVDRAAARARVEAARRAALEESQRLSRFYEEVLTSVGQGILVVDSDGQVRFANPEASRVLGESESGLESQAAVPLMQMLVETLAERQPRTRMIAVEQEEEKVFLYASTSLLRNVEGQVTGAIATISDRSAEKRLEEQLVHTERLATLGSLLASIAHEVNNTLTSITGCAEMGLEVADSAEEAARSGEDAGEALGRISGEIREIFDMVLQAGISAQTIANNMLQYSRQTGPGREVREDLNELLRRTIKLMGKHLGVDKVQLEMDLSASPLWVRVEPSKIQQAMINLIVNAVHALQEVEPARRILRLSSLADGGQAVLHVKDLGPGIPPRRLGRIWKPFFTTKGHGTGLGLHISRKVIEDEGGTIAVESEVGVGTRFTIRLPLE